METMSDTDYKAVLRFYDIKETSLSPSQRKTKAEELLATKLCRCIKKVEARVSDRSQSFAVCSDSVLSKKGLTMSRVSCSKTPLLSGLKPKKSRRRRPTSSRGKKARTAKRIPVH